MEKKLFSTTRRRSVIQTTIRLVLLLFLVGLAALPALAQQVRVSGVVKDIDGKALPGVSIVVKGTATGTTTDIDGKFTIDVPNQRSVLVFSLVGHANKEETVGTRKTVDLTLSESASNLDEVV